MWWSRLARPALHAWAAADQPVRLVEQTVAKTDPDPKALACYGVLVRWPQPDGATHDQMWLRFVAGRPVSAVTTQFLAWCGQQAARARKTALILIWDNASWHISQEVRAWIRTHNRGVKQAGTGVRLVVCHLPVTSPWLNAIEPKWVYGKRCVTSPDRLLGARELADRVCATFACPHHDHLSVPDKAVPATSLLETLVPEKAA